MSHECQTGRPTAGNLSNLFKSNKSSPLAAIEKLMKIRELFMAIRVKEKHIIAIYGSLMHFRAFPCFSWF